jgi:uncharacterized protein (DUF2141 family)
MAASSGHAARIARPATRAALALALFGALVAPQAHAGDLVVRITGLQAPLGQVGCALFASANGFPMDNAGARLGWQAADARGVTCRYANLPAGTYALSIGHDRNGNRRVDTNFLGMPTEQWAVSNNVRPSLRPPRFDEAAFRITAGAGETVIDIEVAQ